ncbi:hypothetical protein GCM10010279_01510 [Streptomyces mutabilis]|nr:hypothetical protein GCM10010279_01510 [Streptomyces mutabilis]
MRLGGVAGVPDRTPAAGRVRVRSRSRSRFPCDGAYGAHGLRRTRAHGPRGKAAYGSRVSDSSMRRVSCP